MHTNLHISNLKGGGRNEVNQEAYYLCYQFKMFILFSGSCTYLRRLMRFSCLELKENFFKFTLIVLFMQRQGKAHKNLSDIKNRISRKHIKFFEN